MKEILRLREIVIYVTNIRGGFAIVNKTKCFKFALSHISKYFHFSKYVVDVIQLYIDI